MKESGSKQQMDESNEFWSSEPIKQQREGESACAGGLKNTPMCAHNAMQHGMGKFGVLFFCRLPLQNAEIYFLVENTWELY